MPAAPVPRVCRPCRLTRAAQSGLIPRACWTPSNLDARRAANAMGEVCPIRRKTQCQNVRTSRRL
jgi:hypothetical protein